MVKQSETLKNVTLLDESTGELVTRERVRNSHNFVYQKTAKKSGPDMTIPDQTMSLREIVDKHSRGMVINGQKTAIFDEADQASGINPWTLDLVDLQELKIMNDEQIINLQNRAKEEIKSRKEKADVLRQKIQDEAAEEIFQKVKEKEKKTNTP